MALTETECRYGSAKHGTIRRREAYRELKERSAVPAGYTYFVEKVRTYREEGLPLEEAIDGAIADCIEGHIPEEFF